MTMVVSRMWKVNRCGRSDGLRKVFEPTGVDAIAAAGRISLLLSYLADI